jgi:hypothetical protein
VEKFRSWTEDHLYQVISSATEGSHNFVCAKLELERRNQLKNGASASRIETASWIMVVAALLSLAVALIGLFRGPSDVGRHTPGSTVAVATPSAQGTPPR